MLDRISSAEWSTADVLTFAGLILTCVTIGVATGGLLVSWLTHRASLRLERAKLAMALWDRQAEFVGDYYPKLRDFLDRLVETGITPDDETTRRINAVRNTVLAHSPFLPRETMEACLQTVSTYRKIIARSSTADALPGFTEIRQKVLTEASVFLADLIEEKGGAGRTQEESIRTLLHTQELTDARAEALGLGRGRTGRSES
jgi:hypothetical protein